MATGSSPEQQRDVPGGDVRDAIIAAFREVLRSEAVDASDDFFELGGDSLLGVQVAARLNETTGIDVPVALLFTYPTADELAGAIAHASTEPEPFDHVAR
jgi:acyl carrier protein